MMIEIGIGIIAFGTGMFFGSMIEKIKNKSTEKSPASSDSIFSRWVEKKKLEKFQKKAENEYRTKLKQNARAQALREMHPELVKHMKEEERKKLTGEDKKDKLTKFANAFSMGGQGQGGFNTSNKIADMLGTGQPPTQQTYVRQPPRPPAPRKQPSARRQARPPTRPAPTPAPQQQAPSPIPQQQFDPFSTEKLNMMLGGAKTATQTAKEKKAEEERLKSFI